MRIRTFVVSLLLLWPVAATAQTVNYLKFTPSVVPAQPTEPFLLEAEMTGQPTRVFLEYQPVGVSTIIELRDNGAGGDRQAGDNIWTAQVPVLPILAARRADDVHRVFFGFLNILNGTPTSFAETCSSACIRRRWERPVSRGCPSSSRRLPAS